jgi:hypothetical protein
MQILKHVFPLKNQHLGKTLEMLEKDEGNPFIIHQLQINFDISKIETILSYLISLFFAIVIFTSMRII